MGRAKFKLNGYEMIGLGSKTCVIHKKEFIIQNVLKEPNDDYNLIVRVSNDIGNLIV
jgi:hypothetical protein